MKQGFQRIAIFAALTVLVACTADTHEKNPDTVRVKLPWYSEGAGYSLQEVTVTTISDMVVLKGSMAHFLMSPGVDHGQLFGFEPRIRTMRTNDGTYIPEDFLSSQLLTLYAHFEKLANLDVLLGVNLQIPNWPHSRVVAVSVQTTDPRSGQVGRDNAMYSGDYDAFYFALHHAKFAIFGECGSGWSRTFSFHFLSIGDQAHGPQLSRLHATNSARSSTGLAIDGIESCGGDTSSCASRGDIGGPRKPPSISGIFITSTCCVL